VDRRAFLGTVAGSLLAAPLASEAQRGTKVWRIGVLETTSAGANATNLAAFRQALSELGYAEGRNIVFEYRFAEGAPERFKDLAAELVRLKVDLILTRGTPAVLAAKAATQTIPVVMAASGDPILSGVVPNLAKPGGNVTGLSAIIVEISGKRLELLRQVVPALHRLGVLLNMGNPNNALQRSETERVARSVGVQLQELDVRKPGDLAPAFEAATRRRTDGLFVLTDAITQAHLGTIVQLAARHRLPAMYSAREFVEGGGLISYGVNYADLYRRSAQFVDKIFKGAKPGDLPVEQPTRFELLINLKTAKALGLTIPQSLLLRADEVIQ
jgi:putative ABC transport system substrate-binding protein